MTPCGIAEVLDQIAEISIFVMSNSLRGLDTHDLFVMVKARFTQKDGKYYILNTV